MSATSLLAQEIVEGQGYVLLPQVLQPEQVAEARSLVLQRIEVERAAGKTRYREQRERVLGLVYKGKIFEAIAQHPRVLPLVHQLVETATLSGFSAHILYPGAKPMGVHVDYPYLAMRSPYPADRILSVQVIWMLDDFTQTNGASVMAPHTHKRRTPPDPAEFAQTGQVVTGAAGSVILSHGLCWHDTSINQSSQPRVSLLCNYAPRYIRPLEDPLYDFDSSVYDRFSPDLQELLCLDLHAALFRNRRRRSRDWFARRVARLLQ